MEKIINITVIVFSFFLITGVARVSANTAPVALDDIYAVGAGEALSIDRPGVLANDKDAESDLLTAVMVSGPTHGTMGDDGLLPDGSFEYKPDTGFVGEDSFTYRAHDGTEAGNAATVKINIKYTGATTVFADEASYLDVLTTLGYGTVREGFEDEPPWDVVRSTITAPAPSPKRIQLPRSS